MADGTVTLVGVTLGLAGAAVLIRSAVLLLGRGRPRRGPTPVFILAGPYLRCRNPLLGGGILLLTGIAVACVSPRLALLALAGAAGAHAWVVGIEEPRLRARFGDAYVAYLRSVPRWLPRLRRGSTAAGG